MPTAKNSRKLKLSKKFKPCPTRDYDELFPNGIFVFNISRIMEDIESGNLKADRETINVKEWFSRHLHGSINEEHLPTVDISKPILQAEIRPGGFNIVDGNHRIEKAFRDGTSTIESYKLYGEKLIPYFIETKGYEAFVGYWNEKVKMDAKFELLKQKQSLQQGEIKNAL